MSWSGCPFAGCRGEGTGCRKAFGFGYGVEVEGGLRAGLGLRLAGGLLGFWLRFACFGLRLVVVLGGCVLTAVVLLTMLSAGGCCRFGLVFFLALAFEFGNASLVACGEVGGRFFDFVFGEPAGSGEIGGAGGTGFASLLALLLIDVFGNGPLGLEGTVGAAVFLLGGEFVAVQADGFFDLLGEGELVPEEPALVGEAVAHGGVGDGEEAGGGAGAVGLDGAVEEALHDLRGDERDGGVVFKEGDAVVSFDAGEGGLAVLFVGMAVMIAGEGTAAALVAAGSDVAALAGRLQGVLGLGYGCGFSGRGCGGGLVGV
jgi:hypothetical protein